LKSLPENQLQVVRKEIMARDLSIKTAISSITKKYPRSTNHVTGTRDRLFDTEIVKVTYTDENGQELSSYVCSLNGNDHIFESIDDLLGFVKNHSSEIGIGKANYLQMFFDNTSSILAIVLILVFAIALIVDPKNSQLIDILKVSLGLALGSFFTSQKRKGKQ
jgi:hypothetical protein